MTASGESVEGEGISDEWAKPPSNLGENTMMEAAERGISDEETVTIEGTTIPRQQAVKVDDHTLLLRSDPTADA